MLIKILNIIQFKKKLSVVIFFFSNEMWPYDKIVSFEVYTFYSISFKNKHNKKYFLFCKYKVCAHFFVQHWLEFIFDVFPVRNTQVISLDTSQSGMHMGK